MVFNLEELNNIDLKNLGSLPWAIKIIIIAVIGIVILIGGFVLVNRPQLQELDQQQAAENDLRMEFESKQSKASHLEIYRHQITDIQVKFGELLHKLPSQTEVPGLLDDISAAGVSSGLQFNQFKPKKEIENDFYVQLPVEIQVMGTYHQFAEFVSKLSALDRIVTVHDFTIEPERKTTSNVSELSMKNNLKMRIVVRTYRYKEQKYATVPKKIMIIRKK